MRLRAGADGKTWRNRRDRQFSQPYRNFHRQVESWTIGDQGASSHRAAVRQASYGFMDCPNLSRLCWLLVWVKSLGEPEWRVKRWSLIEIVTS